MFNVLKFSNNKTSHKYKNELRLVLFNKSLESRIYPYVLLSLFSNKLDKFDNNELNKISNNYKKLLNKYVSRNFNLKFLNLNIEKTKNVNNKHFDILSNLLNLNITIFSNKNGIIYNSSKNYKKSLYFLLKNKKLYLIAKKNKSSLSYQFKNKLLSGGANNDEPGAKRVKVNPTILPENNIGLFNPEDGNDNWYSIRSVNDFLKKNCELCNSGTGEAAKASVEIIIATFTNYYRNRIYDLIYNINVQLDASIIDLNGIMFDYFKRSEEIERIVLILSGGDAFNNLLNVDVNQNNRPVSPDIDCKLVINCKTGRAIHSIKSENYNDNLPKDHQKDCIMFNFILLLVRNKLNHILNIEVSNLQQEISVMNSEFQNITGNLYEHCKILMDGAEIQYLKGKCGENKDLYSFKKRFVHMEAGVQSEKKMDDPFRINNVLLYAIDCIYKYETSWTSIAGILDIVISLPGHTGYMLQENYNYNNNLIHNMNKDYYIKQDNLKMVEYGLRTANKKILKDYNRIILLLNEDNDLNKRMTDIKQGMLNQIEKLKKLDDYRCFISNLEDLKKDINDLNNRAQSGGGLFDGIYNYIYCEKQEKNKFEPFDLEITGLTDNDDDNDDDNNRLYTEHKRINSQMEQIKRMRQMKNLKRSRVRPSFGGENNDDNEFVNNNQLSVMDVKLPKALYYLVSDKVSDLNVQKYSRNQNDKNKIMKPIINYKYIKEYVKNEYPPVDLIIQNINYEKLTELKVKNPGKDKLEENIINSSQNYYNGLNSSALFRINNTMFNTWGVTPKGLLTQFNKEQVNIYGFKSDTKFKFNFITNILLEQIKNNIINFGEIKICELYYFDIDIKQLESFMEVGSFISFRKFISKEVAKCLLHTVMYPFCIEYMREQPMYYRFLGNKFIGDEYKPTNFNYIGFLENNYELPQDTDFQNSKLKEFLDFYDIIKNIAQIDLDVIEQYDIEKTRQMMTG